MQFELLVTMRGTTAGIASIVNTIGSLLQLGVMPQAQYDIALARIYANTAGPLKEVRRITDDEPGTADKQVGRIKLERQGAGSMELIVDFWIWIVSLLGYPLPLI